MSTFEEYGVFKRKFCYLLLYLLIALFQVLYFSDKFKTHESVHSISYNSACALNEDQPAHYRRLESPAEALIRLHGCLG